MSHEPLTFLNGTFSDSQQRWTTVDKKGFATVSTFRRLEYLFCGEECTSTLTTATWLTSSNPRRAVRRRQSLRGSDSRIGRWCSPCITFIHLVSAIVGGICCLGGSMSRRWPCGLPRCSRAVRRMRLCRQRTQFVRYSSRLGLLRTYC